MTKQTRKASMHSVNSHAADTHTHPNLSKLAQHVRLHAQVTVVRLALKCIALGGIACFRCQ